MQLLEHIAERQGAIIHQSLLYRSRLIARDIDPNLSRIAFSGTWCESPGQSRALAGTGTTVGRFSAWIAHLRVVAAGLLEGEYDATGWVRDDACERTTRIVFSWCQRSDFSETGEYCDRYFRMSSRADPDTRFVLFSYDGWQPPAMDSNILLIRPRHASVVRRVPGAFLRALRILLRRPSRIARAVHRATSSEGLATATEEPIRKLARSETTAPPCFIAYEVQPFQFHLIRIIREHLPDSTIIGSVHSCLPPLPCEYQFDEDGPDEIWVSGATQAEILINDFDWPTRQVRVTPSLRFAKSDLPQPNQILLPWDISVAERTVDDLIAALRDDIQLRSDTTVRLHPVMSGSPRHQAVAARLKAIIRQQPNLATANQSDDLTVVFGTTTALVLALEAGHNVIQITDRPEIDLFHPRYWPSLEVTQLGDAVFAYRLINEGSLVSLPHPESLPVERMRID